MDHLWSLSYMRMGHFDFGISCIAVACSTTFFLQHLNLQVSIALLPVCVTWYSWVPRVHLLSISFSTRWELVIRVTITACKYKLRTVLVCIVCDISCTSLCRAIRHYAYTNSIQYDRCMVHFYWQILIQSLCGWKNKDLQLQLFKLQYCVPIHQ